MLCWMRPTNRPLPVGAQAQLVLSCHACMVGVVCYQGNRHTIGGGMQLPPPRCHTAMYACHATLPASQPCHNRPLRNTGHRSVGMNRMSHTRHVQENAMGRHRLVGWHTHKRSHSKGLLSAGSFLPAHTGTSTTAADVSVFGENNRLSLGQHRLCQLIGPGGKGQ